MKLIVVLMSVLLAASACSKDEKKEFVVSAAGASGSSGSAGSGSGSGGTSQEAYSEEAELEDYEAKQAATEPGLSYREKNNLKFAHLETFDGPQLRSTFGLEIEGETKTLNYPDFAGNSALNACSLTKRSEEGINSYSMSFSLGKDYSTSLSTKLSKTDYFLIKEFVSQDEFLAEDFLEITDLSYTLNLQELGAYYSVEAVSCNAKVRPVALDYFHYNNYQDHYYSKGFAIEFQCKDIDKQLSDGVQLMSANVTYYCSVAETDYTY